MNEPAPLAPIDLAQAANGIDRIPSPSAIAPELLRHIDDENLSSTEFANLIARDHGLVVRMLRVANSSFYGMSGRVSSITDAIAILGLRTVRTLILLSTFSDTFSRMAVTRFDMEAFWRHGLATAVGARVLARRLRLPEGSAFVAGLLHDVGYLVLASCYPDHLTAVLEHPQAQAGNLQAAEVAILGLDHTRLGAFLAKRWHFPEDICDGIACHHQPSPDTPGSLGWTVRLADAVSHRIGAVGIPAEPLEPVPESTWAALGIAANDSDALIAEIHREFDQLSELFGH